MKRAVALAALVPLVPAALGALASPASAGSAGVCKQLFTTKKTVRTVTAGAYVMPAESGGTLIDKYGVLEGESIAIKACVIYDIDRDGRLDKGEPGAGITATSFDFPDDGDGELDHGTDAYSIQVPQSPPDGQLCWRVSWTTTRADGSVSKDLTSTCFRADYLPY